MLKYLTSQTSLEDISLLPCSSCFSIRTRYQAVFSCYPCALGDIVCQGRAIGHNQIPNVQDEQEVIAIDVAYIIRPPHLRVSLFQLSKQKERPSSEQSINHKQPLLQYDIVYVSAGHSCCWNTVLFCGSAVYWTSP